MKFTAFTIGALAGAAAVSAQAANQSLCDKYSTALLKSTDAAQQKTLLTLVVNSALIGNYSNATAANAPVKPSGILTKDGEYQGTKGINLLKYFTGELASTNRNGAASSVNFLDGGGADPLKQNKASWDNATDSNQAKLITHLYSYFGALLGCSSLGKGDVFPQYQGNPSQYDVHKFMNLDPNELGYFIQEVAYSALSFGVTMDDVNAVGKVLGSTFNNRCGAPAAIAGGSAQVQSICLDPSCPAAPDSACTAQNQGDGKEPAAASGTPSSGSNPSSGGNGGNAGTSTPPSSGESLKAPAFALLGAALGAAALL